MASTFDVRTEAGRFRLVAIAEAISWAGLLIGVYFKRVHSSGTEIGVQVFGPVHGVLFLLYVFTALMVGMAVGWGVKTWLLALLGGIVPLGSVFFVMSADRAGQLESAESAAAQPGEPAPTTT
ncbi:DUF3817 domain-containing protein [Mycolicibacterium lutetiense]|uniref:Integral membrane protein n=1 Tax=Mycolicibacterium lutetiense TaxID=1641992 RepID=A0ABS4ZQK3_9MYCO|nr:DUF3817 domain-containing protein [Mycolicibacterium lutetiense]MBP2450909.1 integral membrane protein [Mycolicibacterium lutetiense]